MDENIDNSDLFLNLMDNMSDHIYFKDLKSRFIMLNDSTVKWHGFDSQTEAIGKTDFDLFTAEHAQKAFDDEQEIIRTGKPVVGIIEKETWQSDDHISWVSTTKMPLRDKDGIIIGTFGISRDITEHKNAEDQIEKYASELQFIHEEMEEELRMAGELQKAFLPSIYPAFPEGAPEEEQAVLFRHLYHSSGLIGGDFCSIRKISDDEVGMLLCDVMGHGVRAALGTAFIRALVEEIGSTEKDPGKFMERMNHALFPILHTEELIMFATAIYLTFNVRTGVVKFSNAGHPRPLHIERVESRAQGLGGEDTPIGPAFALAEDSKYVTCEYQLNPKDAVVLFTDGLFEIANRGGEEFGEDRLREAAVRLKDLRLRDFFPELLKAVGRFSEDNDFDDDVCLVGFRFMRPLEP